MRRSLSISLPLHSRRINKNCFNFFFHFDSFFSFFFFFLSPSLSSLLPSSFWTDPLSPSLVVSFIHIRLLICPRANQTKKTILFFLSRLCSPVNAAPSSTASTSNGSFACAGISLLAYLDPQVRRRNANEIPTTKKREREKIFDARFCSAKLVHTATYVVVHQTKKTK